MPTLLDELVVQGVRNTFTQSLAQALSGGLSGAVGNLASSGSLNGLKFSDPHLQQTVKDLQAKLPGTQAPSPTTEVSPVVVSPSAAPSAAGGALGQALAGASTLAGGAGSDTISPPPSSVAQQDDTTEVSPLTVTTKASGSAFPTDLMLPAGAAGLALLAAGASGGGGGASPALANTVSPVTVTGQPPVPTQSITPTEAAVGGGVLGAGTGAAVSGDGGGADTLASGSGADTLAGAAGGLPFGLTTKDLIAGGLLGGSLLAGDGGLGGGSDGANAAGSLSHLADSNAALADRLGNVATAGMSGNIGGMGLNSIGRMVRKAQAAIKQRYSALGMSGSTAEQQDLQAAADSGVDLQFKVGQEMASTGLNAIAALTGQSAQIYAQLLNAQTAKDTALGNALANFAGSLVR